MKTILVFVAIISAVGFLGCRDNTADKASLPETALENPQEMPHYPDFYLAISKPGVRECRLGLDFPMDATKSSWTRLACGIDQTIYDARIEFLAKEEKGDRYRVTIYSPYPEGAAEEARNRVVYDEQLLFTGKKESLFSVNAVEFIATK